MVRCSLVVMLAAGWSLMPQWRAAAVAARGASLAFAASLTSLSASQAAATPPSSTHASSQKNPSKQCAAQQIVHSNYKVAGMRFKMEDECFVSPDGTLAGVFDGHGGAGVSKYVVEHFPPTFDKLLPQFQRNATSPAQAVADTFVAALKQVDDEVCSRRQLDEQGSTACLAYVQFDEGGSGDGHIITANLGDSRAVLARANKAIALTKDHKPNDPEEYARILEVGGFVRVWGVPRVNGNLALSRAIGDKYERPAMSSEPTVDIHELIGAKDEFIIIGTDGLWDVFTPKEAVQFVRKTMQGSVGALGDDDVPSARLPDVDINQWAAQHPNDREMVRAVMLSRKQNMAKYLTEQALQRGSSDNISVVVLWLK